jgi:hypothetical protein
VAREVLLEMLEQMVFLAVVAELAVAETVDWLAETELLAAEVALAPDLV